jgi:SAM-dependent methyltransferase
MPVTVIDVRPLREGAAGLSFVQEDATELRSVASDSVESLSSLHAVEHFGLGRYGDPIDTQGWLKMTQTLSRVLKPGGRLYFSVPVGRERLEFNAHRVFHPRRPIDAFAQLRLVSFASVDDRGSLRDPCTPEDIEGSNFACGLYEFKKE